MCVSLSAKDILWLSRHEVNERLQGYRILLRAEEVWAITKRSQLYSNFFTKLRLCCTVDASYIVAVSQ